MKNLFEIKSDFLENLLLRCVIILLLMLLLGISFAIFGVYSALFIIYPLFIAFSITYFLSFFYFNRGIILSDFQKNKFSYIIIAAALLFCVFNSLFFFESKIEGGHDQGVFLESAINLAKTGNLLVTDSVVLTYPGFWLNQHGEIISRFLPGYTVYLSPFYHLFGINGFAVANAILLFLGISLLYFLGKTLRNYKTGILLVVFFTLNYYTLYFSRSTFVENLEILLVWSCVYLFIKGYKQKSLDLILYGGLPITLLLLVRFEALLYFFSYIVLFCYFKFVHHFKIERKYAICSIAILNIFVIVLYILYAYRFNSSSIAIPMDIISSFISNPMQTTVLPSAVYNEQLFIWNFMFYVFNAICIPVMLVFGLMNFIKEKMIRKEILLIIFLILPQLLFLVKPYIAFYLPWYMRRFWPVFLPLVFLLFSLFFTNARGILSEHRKFILPVILGSILTINIFQSAPILHFSEGKGLLEFQNRVALNFNQTDLVIFWDRYQYENYGPPLFFLYDIHTIFDRSPAFEKEIYAMYFKKDYENVYIVTSKPPTVTLAHPYFDDEDVEYIKSLEVEDLNFLSYRCDIRDYLIYPESFMGYYQIKDRCRYDNPPTEVIDYSINLNIYKLKLKARDSFVSEFYSSEYQERLFNLKGIYENKYSLGMD